MAIENYEPPEYKVNCKKGVIVGFSNRMKRIFKELNGLASLPTTVLIQGETGTGKELCAKALHYNGLAERSTKKFVAVNCAGIPATLLESTLFGYEQGAFTGATRKTDGLFQAARGGTIFLDEIGEMDVLLQAKILRVLQEKEFTRVGGNVSERTDARIITATNKDLAAEVIKGNFREDLYYRLSVFPINVPPLREREEDSVIIANHFLDKFKREYQQTAIEGFSEEARTKIVKNFWPGNVRELENSVERAIAKRSFKRGLEGKVIKADEIEIFSESIARNKERATVNYKEGGSQVYWYQEGVFPISLRALEKTPGALSNYQLKKLVDKKILYSQGKEGGKNPIIYLTPETFGKVIGEMTPELKKIKEEMLLGEFNQIAKSPFTILNKTEISQVPGALCVKTIRNNSPIISPYLVDPENGIESLVVPMEEAGLYFSSSSNNVRENLGSFVAKIKEFYREFQNLK